MILRGHILDNRVGHDQELSFCHQRPVEPQLFQHVIMGVVGVEQDHYRLAGLNMAFDLAHNVRVDGRSFAEMNSV